jgi:hypothetical protein
LVISIKSVLPIRINYVFLVFFFKLFFKLFSIFSFNKTN